ncbi:MAG: carbohydrate kinase family protein [Myxococcota bacterium]
MGKKRPTAFVFGEVLCDLYAAELQAGLAGSRHLVPHLGGAPANVAVQLARLGGRVELLSAVGHDPLSERLLAALAEAGVGTRHVRRKAGHRVGLTLVEVDERAERQFHPWRDGAADQVYGVDDLPRSALATAALLHRGTVSLRSPRSRQATAAAVQDAKTAGAVLTLDVNLRPRMFPSLERLLQRARASLKTAHVVKATVEEARALVGSGEAGELARALLRRGPGLVLLTAGAEGALLATRHREVWVDAPRVKAVDATGAGDAFMGAALMVLLVAKVTPKTVGALEAHDLEALGWAACHAGAKATTKLGATTGMVCRLPGNMLERTR